MELGWLARAAGACAPLGLCAGGLCSTSCSSDGCDLGCVTTLVRRRVSQSGSLALLCGLLRHLCFFGASLLASAACATAPSGLCSGGLSFRNACNPPSLVLSSAATHLLGLPVPVPLGARGPVVIAYLVSALTAGSLDQYDLGTFASLGLRLSYASVC